MKGAEKMLINNTEYVDFNSSTETELINNNKKVLEEANRILKEKGRLYPYELGLYTINGWSEAKLDPEWEFDLPDIYEDNTIFIDWKEPEIPFNGMMEFIALEADISQKFIALEHRIEVMSGC